MDGKNGAIVRGLGRDKNHLQNEVTDK